MAFTGIAAKEPKARSLDTRKRHAETALFYEGMGAMIFEKEGRAAAFAAQAAANVKLLCERNSGASQKILRIINLDIAICSQQLFFSHNKSALKTHSGAIFKGKRVRAAENRPVKTKLLCEEIPRIINHPGGSAGKPDLQETILCEERNFPISIKKVFA